MLLAQCTIGAIAKISCARMVEKNYEKELINIKTQRVITHKKQTFYAKEIFRIN
jgi:hypothetical protein